MILNSRLCGSLRSLRDVVYSASGAREAQACQVQTPSGSADLLFESPVSLLGCRRNMIYCKATLFNFVCFRSEKIKNLIREGGDKKTVKKKNIEPIFGKVIEGDQIKKTLDIFLEKNF